MQESLSEISFHHILIFLTKWIKICQLETIEFLENLDTEITYSKVNPTYAWTKLIININIYYFYLITSQFFYDWYIIRM